MSQQIRARTELSKLFRVLTVAPQRVVDSTVDFIIISRWDVPSFSILIIFKWNLTSSTHNVEIVFRSRTHER